MKVLWITNIVFPEAESIIKGTTVEQKGGGGWMIASALKLLENDDINLFVASLSKQVKELTVIKGEKITYFIIPYGKGNEKINREYEKHWIEIKKQVKPDVIHIHGSEFTQGLSYVKSCGPEHVVVSIQGMKSAYYYYYYGLKIREIISGFTLRCFIDGGIFREYKRFKHSSTFEVELLKSINHIIGRTSWDRARTWAINSSADYHFCNETLREEFYTGIWEYNKCEKHTIFFSQAHYPIKGLHMMLRALSLVKKLYPDVKLKVAGGNIIRTSAPADRLKLTNYGKIIRKYIYKYHLEECVSFCGLLDAEQMKKQYLKANVFVCASTIENSPNSLGEAQLLGVPCISSYVGGAMDMIPNDNCGYLYRFEEVEMLAYKICDIFAQSKSFDNSIMRQTALARHDKQHNAETLINIYKSIVIS